jgi:hypothetical protein
MEEDEEKVGSAFLVQRERFPKKRERCVTYSIFLKYGKS